MNLLARRPTAAVLLALVVVGSSCGKRDRDHPTVKLFLTRITLLPDGSADVEEVWVIKTVSTATSFSRRIPPERRDGLTSVTAFLNDRPVAPAGASDTIIWPIAPDPPRGVHEARLRYRAAGAIEVSGLRGTFVWHALPAGRDWPVGGVRIDFTLPPGINPVSDVRMAEPGWQVTKTADGIIAERAEIGRGESATLLADLILEAGSMSRPVWQENAERAKFLLPAFISGGLFILVVGLGVLVMIAWQARTWTPADRAATRRGLRVSGSVTVALGVLVSVATPPLLGHYGHGPMAIPASIVMVALRLLVGTGLTLWKTPGTSPD